MKIRWPGIKSLARLAWEGRTSLENPQTPLSYPAEWLLDIFNGGRTDSGLRVSELTALQVPDVLACVTRISGAIAGQPIKIYERIETGQKILRHSKRMAVEHPMFDVLRYRPNDEMTRATFVRTFVCHMLLWGNGYAEIQRDAVGRPVALWPRNPTRTRPRRLLQPIPDDENPYPMVYITSEGMEQMDQNFAEGVTGQERVIRKENMLHVPGLALDGRLGQDTVWLCRQSIGLSLAAEKYAAKFFGNGATPSGILEHPGTLKKELRDALRNMWMESQGGENIHRPAILEGGLKFTKIAALPSEAQMIEARKQQRSEIAAIFGMPITMLGETGASRANAEQVALEFVNYTLRPWVVAIEEEMKVKLFPEAQVGRNAGRTYMALIELRNLELPDANSKRFYYGAARQWGWETANGVLEQEDENPIPGALGESYLIPVNMVAVDADGKVVLKSTNSANQGSGPASIPGEGVDQGKANSKSKISDLKAAREALWPIFRDAFGRYTARERRNSADFERIFGPILHSLYAINTADPLLTDLYMKITSRIGGGVVLPNAADRAAQVIWGESISTRKDEGKSGIYLARHGVTDDDVEGQSDDFKPEEPLNAEGIQQAQALARYALANVPDASLYCGSPVRHQQTAAAIADTEQEEPEGDVQEGEPEDPIAGIEIVAGLDPQGKLESDAQFEQRIIKAIQSIQARAASGENCLLVTSHKAIRAYAKKLGVGAGDIGFCSLWEVSADGVTIAQIFKPGA